MAESRDMTTAAAGPVAWPPSFTFSTRLTARGAFLVSAALVLLAWGALLFGVLRRGQTVAFEVALRPQHYLQACLQGTLILYWGFYWREVYHAAPLIVAQ